MHTVKGKSVLITGASRGIGKRLAMGFAAEGAWVSVAGLPNSQLKGAGKAFLAAFTKANGKAPDPYSVYAAQAAVVMLNAIAKSNGTRAGLSFSSAA